MAGLDENDCEMHKTETKHKKKRAKLLFFIVKYAKFVTFLTPRRVVVVA